MLDDQSIFELMVASWKARVVLTAVRLKIFTVLSSRMLTANELARECESRPVPLKALLDACVSMGFIEYQNGTYKNSDFSRQYLVEGEPFYLGDYLQLQDDESVHWDRLADIVLGTRKRRSDDARYRTFIKAMDNLAKLGEAEALKNAVDLSGKTRMVDAGGGSGFYTVVLCQEYPALHSTILDRRETLAITREMISVYQEKERITLKEADILEDSFGHDFDVVLLSDVIYEGETAAIVLKHAYDALNAEGILIVRGYYAHTDNTPSLFGALFALGQLVFDPKRQVMTLSDMTRKVSEAGFVSKKVSPLTGRSCLLLATKESQ